MTLEQAQKWTERLNAAVLAGKISRMNAHDEVFAELEAMEAMEAMEAVEYGIDVTPAVEHLYAFTRS